MTIAKKRTQFGPLARRRPRPPRPYTPKEMARKVDAWIKFMKPDGKK